MFLGNPAKNKIQSQENDVLLYAGDLNRLGVIFIGGRVKVRSVNVHQNGFWFCFQYGSVSQANALHGKVVMVLGSNTFDEVVAMNLLNDSVATRCRKTGEFRGAPDPSFSWKKQFTRDVPILAYRSRVIWYGCP